MKNGHPRTLDLGPLNLCLESIIFILFHFYVVVGHTTEGALGLLWALFLGITPDEAWGIIWDYISPALKVGIFFLLIFYSTVIYQIIHNMVIPGISCPDCVAFPICVPNLPPTKLACLYTGTDWLHTVCHNTQVNGIIETLIHKGSV